jgi:hypothetical protein
MGFDSENISLVPERSVSQKVTTEMLLVLCKPVSQFNCTLPKLELQLKVHV